MGTVGVKGLTIFRSVAEKRTEGVANMLISRLHSLILTWTHGRNCSSAVWLNAGKRPSSAVIECQVPASY